MAPDIPDWTEGKRIAIGGGSTAYGHLSSDRAPFQGGKRQQPLRPFRSMRREAGRRCHSASRTAFGVEARHGRPANRQCTRPTLVPSATNQYPTC